MVFVLPPDVRVEPASDLAKLVRDQIRWRDGDHLVTRPRTRAPSHVIDAAMARLLARFRKPQTIVEAVLAHSFGEGLEPRHTLETAFPGLVAMVRADLLVPAKSALAGEVTFDTAAGSQIGTFDIVRQIDLLLDTEIHLARAPQGRFVAIKIARRAAAQRMRARLAHEARIYSRVGGRIAPRLVEHGETDGRPYLVIQWCPGADAATAAAEARSRSKAGRPLLARIIADIAGAYASLNHSGFLHGDIHPRNLIIGGRGGAFLIDFGFASELAADTQSGHPVERGVIDLYMEPELARARLGSTPLPPPTTAGEQYAVAALLYGLITGGPTHRFSLEKAEMQDQVISAPPLAFSEHGIDGWTRTEQVLRRALAKTPSARYSSMDVFAEELEPALAQDLEGSCARGTSYERHQACKIFLDSILDRLEHASTAQAWSAPPLASVDYGAAGTAYALLRLASSRGDGALLAMADLWSSRAVSLVSAQHPGAFASVELELPDEKMGAQSLHHGAAGVFLVHALVAHARCDRLEWRDAVQGFLTSYSTLPAELDIAFGCAGALIGTAHILAPVLFSAGAEVEQLRKLGNTLAAQLESALPLGGHSIIRSLGAAHGLAGILHSLLVWSKCTGRPIADSAVAALHELGLFGEPFGRQWRWPIYVGTDPQRERLVASWCNGAAGYVPLWTLAYELLRDDHFLDLAIGGGWTVYEATAGGADLCCGLSGRAYALLSLYRQTEDALWFDRAREIAERAAMTADTQERPFSLYKGGLGAGLLEGDLDRPEESVMPLYEIEPWPVRLTMPDAV